MSITQRFSWNEYNIYMCIGGKMSESLEALYPPLTGIWEGSIGATSTLKLFSRKCMPLRSNVQPDVYREDQ